MPIIPGIMPVTSVKNIKRITELCKSEIPPAFERELDRREDDTEAVEDLGVAYSTLQCVDLLSRGAPGHPLLHAEPLARDARDPGRAARRAAVDAGLAAGLAARSAFQRSGSAPSTFSASPSTSRWRR